MTPAAFDFRTPPPGLLERDVSAWVARACRRAATAWARVLPFPTELAPGPVETVTAGLVLARMPDDTVAFPAATADPADGVGLVALRRPLLLGLLTGLLGETPTEEPADREPTDLEQSVVGYLARELFLGPLEAAWQGGDPPRLAAGPVGPPRTARKGGADEDPVVLAGVAVSTPFGAYEAHLLLPRAGRWEKLGRAARPAPPPPADPDHIAALVAEMPVDLEAVLGTADLTMAGIAGLRPGDVVVLDQKVDEPLDALVSGARKFRVWPGSIGPRAAIQVFAPAE